MAAVTGVSLGSIWLLDSHHQQEELATTLQRFPWTLRAAEEKPKLPRVYFIIRFGAPPAGSGIVNMSAGLNAPPSGSGTLWIPLA